MSEHEFKDKTNSQQYMHRHHDAGFEGEEIDISEIINVIKSQKIFIAIVMAISLFVACIYIINLAPKFQSTALIQIDNNSGGINDVLKSLDSSSSGSGGLFGSNGASPAQIEKALITSRFILQPTIESLGLNIRVEQRYFPIFGAYIARHYKGDNVAKPLMNFTSYSWGGEKVAVTHFVIPEDYSDRQFKLKIGNNGSYKLYAPDGKFVLDGVVGKLSESPEFGAIPGIKILVTTARANLGAEFFVSASPVDGLIGDFAGKLSIVDIGVSTGVATGVMNVGLQGEDPEQIPKILNTIVYYDMQKNADKKTAEVQKTLNFLDEQSKNLRSELDVAEGALSDYKAKEGVLGIKAG